MDKEKMLVDILVNSDRMKKKERKNPCYFSWEKHVIYVYRPFLEALDHKCLKFWVSLSFQ